MSSNQWKSFVERCMHGEVLMDEIDDFIDQWHKTASKLELHEFLGMTSKEYALWVSDPSVLPFIITAHKEKRGIRAVLEEFETLPLAARAGSPAKALALMKWLKAKGKFD